MEQGSASLEHSPSVAELPLGWVALTQALKGDSTDAPPPDQDQ